VILLLLALLQSTTKEAMRPVQPLVGEWRVQVDGPQPWSETQAWEYKIEGQSYALQFTVKDGKKFKDGVLSYDVPRKLYRLDATRADGGKATFEGKLEGKELTLEEKGTDAVERLTFNLLRENRFIGRIERREAGQKVFTDTHQYQFTRAGTSIVKSEGPKCVVTGGSAAMAVQHEGQTYYVCCSTCRKEFNAAPAKVIEQAKKEGLLK
jgi:YHS domain-containing protein